MDQDSSDHKPANKWMIGFWVLLVILAIRSCADDGETAPNPVDAYSVDGAVDAAAEGAGDTSDPANPDDAAIQLAGKHAGRAFGAMGSEGARLYSEWCYEALEREFTTTHRDRCYAFDLFASRLLSEGDEDNSSGRFEMSRIQSRWVSAPTALFETSEPISRRTAIEAEVSQMAVVEIEPPLSNMSATRTVEPDEPAVVLEEQSQPASNEILSTESPELSEELDAESILEAMPG